MNDAEERKQIEVIARIKFPFYWIRRDNWKLRIDHDGDGRVFVWKTKDGEKGELKVMIKSDWSCELVEASGPFQKGLEQCRQAILKNNQEQGKANGKDKDS